MKNKRGFSLIELMVAISIIAVLMGIGVVSYVSANRNARNAKRSADLEQVRAALELYRSENPTYPPQGSGTPQQRWNTLMQTLNPYLSNSSTVADPRAGNNYLYLTGNPPASPANNCRAYGLCATYEDPNGSTTTTRCICNP